MSSSHLFRLLGALVLVVLTACAGQHLPMTELGSGLASQGVTSPLRTHAALPATAAVNTGSLVLHIHWPSHAYQGQLIPQAAQEIDLSATTGSFQSPTATTSVVFPTSTATLSALPAGSYTLLVQAFQSPSALINGNTKTLVAQATASAVVNGNQANSANVTLRDAVPPSLTQVNTNTGQTVFWQTIPSNLQLVLSGYGLTGFGVVTPTVTVGAASAAFVRESYGNGYYLPSGAATGNPDSVFVSLPANSTGGTVTLTVDGQSASSSVSLLTATSASISPTSASVAHSPSGSQTFTATVLANGSPLPAAALSNLTWAVVLQGAGDPGQVQSAFEMFPGSITGSGATVLYTASSSVPIPDTATTSTLVANAHVVIELFVGGSLAATAGVTVN